MNWMERMIFGGFLLRAPEGDTTSAPPPTTPPDSGKELEQMRAANKALEERLAKLEGVKTPKDDPGLEEKARLEREAKEKTNLDGKKLEAAIRFNMTSKEWAKTNAALLPKDVDGILSQADKESYDSAIQKDCAIKSALAQSFFNVQANLDLLTSSQKIAIEDFLKLTKNGKEEKAQHIYESIFEPTFEMLKRLEKAKQLRSDGHSSTTDADQAYKEKMIKLSRKHYTGEKNA